MRWWPCLREPKHQPRHQGGSGRGAPRRQREAVNRPGLSPGSCAVVEFPVEASGRLPYVTSVYAESRRSARPMSQGPGTVGRVRDQPQLGARNGVGQCLHLVGVKDPVELSRDHPGRRLDAPEVPATVVTGDGLEIVGPRARSRSVIQARAKRTMGRRRQVRRAGTNRARDPARREVRHGAVTRRWRECPETEWHDCTGWSRRPAALGGQGDLNGHLSAEGMSDHV